ncbi:MAG: hypothetical protein RLO10_05175 [Roseovarius indicus]
MTLDAYFARKFFLSVMLVFSIFLVLLALIDLVDELQFILHSRFTQALMCIVAAMIGFATLLLGSFSRFGVWWQILMAFVILVVIKLIESSVTSMAISDSTKWPFMYLPAGLGFLTTLGLLNFAARPGLLRRLIPKRRNTAGGAA